MAVFTQVSHTDVEAFLAAYGLPAPEAVTGIAEGIENTNYKIMAGGTRYILTLYEARVDPTDLPYFLALMEEVAGAGLPAAKALRMKDGTNLGTLNGRPAALIEFLSGRPNMAPTPQDARKAGRVMAQFHHAAAGLKTNRPNSMGLSSWKALAARAGSELNRFGEELEAEISATIRTLEERWPSNLPRGQIHADLFPDNLLLDHGDVSGVIDFYFACTDDLAYDLAIGMNAYTPETSERNFDNAAAMLDGYQEIRPLSDDEHKALPVLLTGSALRFFMTRAVDSIFPPDVDLYTPKDPLPWLGLMRHHRKELELIK